VDSKEERDTTLAGAGPPAPLPGTSRRTWREVVGLCCEPYHLRRTVAVALVVGTVLFAINQLDVVIAGRAGAGTVLKIVLTYLVPFLVSNYGIVHGTGPPARRRV